MIREAAEKLIAAFDTTADPESWVYQRCAPLIDNLRASLAVPAQEFCQNCGHANVHDGPAGAVSDACIFPGCSCGFDSRGDWKPAQVDAVPQPELKEAVVEIAEMVVGKFPQLGKHLARSIRREISVAVWEVGMRVALDREKELSEQRQSFELRWKADMRAIKRWQKATGKNLVWPDHADLCVWLMEQLEGKS